MIRPGSFPARTAAALLAGSLVAWVVVVEWMWGMDASPGMDLGSLGFYLGVWVTMTAAMMLPSVAPMTLAYAQVSRRLGRARPSSSPGTSSRGPATACSRSPSTARSGQRRRPSSGGTPAAGTSPARRSPRRGCTSSRRSSRSAYASAARRCTSCSAAGAPAASAPFGWGRSTAPTASAAASASCSCCSCSA
ncbi:MAG: DUF2182 domain-containing protein [Actinobacteria bacterium]|nr:MAG: DUF2182 domain-containing protein [Actinomycetota bacterium]